MLRLLRVVLLIRIVKLLEQGYDVGIRISALEHAGLMAQPVGHTRHMQVSSPAFLHCCGVPAHPKPCKKPTACESAVMALRGHRFMVSGGVPAGGQW